MRNKKAKGSQGERELVAVFNENGWSCIRAAGSGSSKYPSPDILAGNAVRRVAVECKVTSSNKKYFTKDEIGQLKIFAHKFGAEAWVAVKFSKEQWYFITLEDLEDTGKLLAVSKEKAKLKGLAIKEFLDQN